MLCLCRKISFWESLGQKTTIPLENLPVSIKVGHRFGVFTDYKTEQGLGAVTGCKLTKNMQGYSHQQRQTWFWAAQAKPSNYHQASTETLLHMTQIWQDWQCHIIIATTSPTQPSEKAFLELTTEPREGLISLWVEHDTQQELKLAK